MINNLLGGTFFVLMDTYGLELVSVQTWGFIWGALSLSFILGGLLLARFGLGRQPLRTMFIANLAMWCVGILFPLQASVIFVVVGMFCYMILVPFVEAAEQTVLQKVVPVEKQGRVFGLAQTAETLVSPVTTLVIGPLTQAIFISFMTTGYGASIIGGWFGTGINRGIGLVFILASIGGLIVTTVAFNSPAYRRLATAYAKTQTLS